MLNIVASCQLHATICPGPGRKCCDGCMGRKCVGMMWMMLMDHVGWRANGDDMSASLPLSRKGMKQHRKHLQPWCFSVREPWTFPDALSKSYQFFAVHMRLCKYRRCFEDSCSHVTQRYTKSHWAYFQTVHVPSDGYDSLCHLLSRDIWPFCWKFGTRFGNQHSTGSIYDYKILATFCQHPDMIWDLAQQKTLASLATKNNKKPLESYLTQLIWIYVVKACLSLSLTESDDFKMFCNFSIVITAVKASKSIRLSKDCAWLRFVLLRYYRLAKQNLLDPSRSWSHDGATVCKILKIFNILDKHKVFQSQGDSKSF